MRLMHFFSIAFLLLGICFLNCGYSYAKNVSEKEVRELEEEAKKKALESKRLQAQAIQLNLELSKMDKEVISLAKKIQGNEDKLSTLERDLQKLKSDVATKEELFKKENASLVQMLSSLQNMSLNPSESVILQPHSPVDIIRSAILLRETVPAINEKSSKLKIDLDILYNQKQKIEQNLKKTASYKETLEKQQENMKGLLKKKATLRKSVENKGAETQKIAENLSSKAKDLRDLLEKLERQKELERRKREEAERLARLKREQEQQRLKEVKSVDTRAHEAIKQEAKSSGFARAKGRLEKPVSGYVVTEYGQSISKGVTSKGVVYKTRNNAQVIAPYDGTVIFSGPFKGYGNIIIVEHGDGYLSLLAGLGQIDCDVGQKLLSGEPVGTMPSSGDAKLYVEIRKDRQPINPKPWIAG